MLYRLRTIPKLDRKFLYLELISAIVVYHHLLFVKLTIGWCAAMTIACSVYKSRKDNTFRGSLADVLRISDISFYLSQLSTDLLIRETNMCEIGRSIWNNYIYYSIATFSRFLGFQLRKNISNTEIHDKKSWYVGSVALLWCNTRVLALLKVKCENETH